GARDREGRHPGRRRGGGGRGRPAGRPRRARRRGRAGTRRHGGAPVARRRLPALRGPPVRRRGPVPGQHRQHRRSTMTAIATHTSLMTGRQLRALARQPAYLVISLIQPVIWLFLFWSLFRTLV